MINLKRISTWIYKEKALDSNSRTKISFFCGQINAPSIVFKRLVVVHLAFINMQGMHLGFAKMQSSRIMIISSSLNLPTTKKEIPNSSGHLKSKWDLS